MTTLSERLILAMKRKNVKQADLVRATGLSSPSIHAWVTGTTKNLKGESLVKTASFLQVNTDWLAYGVGQMQLTWPFQRVTPEQVASLPLEALEDIEDIILLKISKQNIKLGSNLVHKA